MARTRSTPCPAGGTTPARARAVAWLGSPANPPATRSDTVTATSTDPSARTSQRDRVAPLARATELPSEQLGALPVTSRAAAASAARSAAARARCTS